MHNTAVLLIDCPDRKGLVATVSGLLYRLGANIIHADQHQDHDAGLFFMRIEWDASDFDLDAFAVEFKPIAQEFRMRWRIHRMVRETRVALFVSRYMHCLADLLHRVHAGELRCSIELVVSNHTEAEALSTFYRVPFLYIPIAADTKQQAEQQHLDALREARVELLVLARYMQVLSPALVDEYPRRIINVHHSFLPAFVGARPYHAAFRRGVKLIGATSHYVTEVLDDGPIIEQDVVRVSHRDQVADLVAKGRDLERVVLARALRWHLEHRILCYGNKTVIFD